jgi:hypothetical protein
MSNTFNTQTDNSRHHRQPFSLYVIIVFLLMIILLPHWEYPPTRSKIIQQLVVVITGIISWVVSSIAFLTGTCWTPRPTWFQQPQNGNRHHRRHHKLGGRPTHKSSSRNNSSLDDSLNRGTPSQNQTTEPSNPENPIQKPISANKTNWCLVGEYQGKRCVEVSDSNKCMSGQLRRNRVSKPKHNNI